MSHPRTAEVQRVTRETDVLVRLSLDRPGTVDCRTGVPFLDHMLDQVAHHGRLSLEVIARGDVEIDDHHTVEDVGITLGQALTRALGDKAGIRRAASFHMPMDDALVLAALDLSGRPYLDCRLEVDRRRIGLFDCELVPEFFRAMTVHGGFTLHLQQIAGSNAHHIVEAAFKAFGRALDVACSLDDRVRGIPSTKGTL